MATNPPDNEDQKNIEVRNMNLPILDLSTPDLIGNLQGDPAGAAQAARELEARLENDDYQSEHEEIEEGLQDAYDYWGDDNYDNWGAGEVE